MKIVLLSKDFYGKWAGILGVLFVVLMILKITLPFFLPNMIIVALGLIGFIMAIIAILKKDFAILNLLTILLGLVIVLWIAAEIMYPH